MLYVTLPTNTQNTFKLSPGHRWTSLHLEIIDHMTVCSRQDLWTKHSTLPSVTYMLDVYQVCHNVDWVCQKWEWFFVESGVKLRDSITGMLLSQQTLDAIRYVADDDFLFQQQCTDALCVQHSSTVDARNSSLSFFQVMGHPTAHSQTPLTTRLERVNTIQHHQYKLRVNTIEEIKEWLFEVWQSG